MDQQTVKPLTYTGEAHVFPIWSTRFVAMMQTKGLCKSLLGTDEQPNEPAALANRAINDKKKNHKVLMDAYEMEIVAVMQTKGLYKSLLGTDEQPNEPAPLANGAINDKKKKHKVLKDAYEKEVADIKEKRNNVWCHLALILDATSLILMRQDCVGVEGI